MAFRSVGDIKESLKHLSQDLQEELYNLRTYDSINEIGSYCDDLQSEVVLSVSSAIEHLKQIETEFLKKIDEYRCNLVNQAYRRRGKEDTHLSAQLASLSSEIESFNEKCASYMGNCNQPIQCGEFYADAQEQTRDYLEKLKDIKLQMRRDAFQSQYLKFKKDPWFFIKNDLIGTFECHESETCHVQTKTGK